MRTFVGAAVMILLLAVPWGLRIAHVQPRREAEIVSIVVAPGDTLWRVALRQSPEIDPRRTIDEIVAINSLADTTIQPGQLLLVPSYSDSR